MALINQLSTAANPLLHPQTADQVTGQRMKKIIRVNATTATDSAGSIYLLGEVPNSAVVTAINIYTADIAGANDNNIGLYDNFGVAKVTNYYADALDFTGHGTVGPAKYASAYNHECMSAVTTATAGDPVWKNAGDVEGPYPASGSTIMASKYQIGMLANGAPTAAITFVSVIEYTCAE